jgi:signal transduction histidine kinase/PAS domain-containing protein
MPIVESELAPSRDPRFAAQLAEHATGSAPAWLWRADGSQILWANAVGAAIFGAAHAGDCAIRRFGPQHPAVLEIARLAATLPSAGQVRLERLRGFGANFGRALTCFCSRVALSDGGAAVFVVAAEPAGPLLTLRERTVRLFSGREGPLAVFAADGGLLFATDAARARFPGAVTLSAFGIDDIASRARVAGSASGMTDNGSVSVERLGSDASVALAALFAAPPLASEAAEGAAANAASSLHANATHTTAAPPEPAPKSLQVEPPTERRHPMRFVWQMDAEGRFVVGSDEFIELMGPGSTAAIGRLWTEIAAELKLDPDDQVGRAVATRETWSGITLSWPVDDGGERLAVELSGLPVFNRDRDFRGYRGFGVCRDLLRINELMRAHHERPIGFRAPPEASADGDGVVVTMAQVAASAGAEATSSPAMTPAAEVPAGPSTLSIVPAAANVVPFRPSPSTEQKVPSLSPVERKAFRDLAQELTARLRDGGSTGDNGANAPPADALAAAGQPIGSEGEPSNSAPPQDASAFEPGLLDRLPLGVLIYRHDAPREELLYANRYFLELSGYQSLEALTAAGGLDHFFAEPGALAQSGGTQVLSVRTQAGDHHPVEGRLIAVPWFGASALALILTDGEAEERRRSTALSLADAEREIRELKEKLDSSKQAEAELRAATREAQKAAVAKADFVSKVSHEIRTPLNAIAGFAEVIIAERFGPIGNERYREYLKDIHTAGMHLVSLLNDLLDLSKVETGQLDLSFANVSLNDLTQQCVGIMQPQASRARIIIRTSLTPGLPQVVADERSLRQIVLNLLSNSIRFTGPGGQVIVSTAFADSGEAVLRVRDTGVGMSEKDVEAVLEPFRQTATSASWGSGGTGLGLPLTKALAEANRAHFSIKSAPNAGTLVEVAFPPTRVVAS